MSIVSLNPLDYILTSNEEKRAFLYGVATYLKRLNSFASSKKTPNLTEYNVGGVVTIVEHLEALASTYRSEEDQELVSEDEDQLFSLLNHSWFCYEDSKNQLSPVSLQSYFNSNFDRSGLLPFRIGQFLLSLEPAINTIKFEMFKVSHSLLARYSDLIKKGESLHLSDPNDTTYQKDKEAVYSQGEDDVKGLLSAFKTLYQLNKITNCNNHVKAHELRKQGNDSFKKSRFGNAIAKYTEAITLDPKNHVIYSNRAAAYTAINDPQSAISDLKESSKLKPDYETAWTRLGFSYLSVGDATKSVEAYCKAIKLASDQNRASQYLQKLCAALEEAETKANENGVTGGLSQYIGPIQDLRERYAQSRPQTQQSQESEGSATPGIEQHLGNLFQQFRNANNANNDGNDPIVRTLNGIGTILSGTDSFQTFGEANNSNRNNQSTNQHGNTPAQPPNQPSDNLSDQPSNQPSNNSSAQHSTNDPTQDPESSIPEANIQNQQQPHNIADLIQNSLPEGLRNTIGPAIRFAMNSARNNGSPSPGANGEVIFTTISTGPNGEVVSHTNDRQGTTNATNNDNNRDQTTPDDNIDSGDLDLD